MKKIAIVIGFLVAVGLGVFGINQIANNELDQAKREIADVLKEKFVQNSIKGQYPYMDGDKVYYFDAQSCDVDVYLKPISKADDEYKGQYTITCFLKSSRDATTTTGEMINAMGNLRLTFYDNTFVYKHTSVPLIVFKKI